MDNAVFMHLFHSLSHFPHNYRSNLLGETLSAGSNAEEMPVSSKLHQEIHVLLIVEAIVDGNDVGVIEKKLNFYFAHQLVQRLLGFLRALAR
jgi:predicted esterase YcpF (UPF0227 family)